MSKSQQILQRMGVVATADITAMRIVSSTGTHAANKGIGIAETSEPIGEAVGVIISGEAMVISGAAFAAGDKLTADSAGKAVKADPSTVASGTIIEVIGVAKEAATGANQECLVIVQPHSLVGTYVPNTLNAETITIAATETITAKQIIGADGKHTANKGVGIATNGGASETDIVVMTKGVTDVVSGAAFAVGDKLTADSAGKAVKYDPTNVNMGTVVDLIGTAMEAATDADQEVSVMINPHVGVGTKAVG